MTELIRLAEEHNSFFIIVTIINLVRLPGSYLIPEGTAANKHFFIIVLCCHRKVWIIGSWPEFVSGHHKEDQGGHLLEHGVQPLVLRGMHVRMITRNYVAYLERNSDPEEVHNDPCEVHVAHHHHIEVPEQLQLL